MLTALHILTLFFLGIPIFIFGLYGILLLHFNKKGRKKNRKEDGEFEPYVSIVVPTHNEELVISKKINNLLNLNYPKKKLEIIFVDDSNDSTPNIIEEYSKKIPYMRLIRFRERIGYSPSMIAGCKAAEGEIIVLNDAGSFIDTQAISNLVRHFHDPRIGAVTGRGIILNTDEITGRLEEKYLGFSDIMRIAETEMDSTFHFNGEASAVRKDLITDFGVCNETFDTTVALFIRQKGYRAIYDPEVKFYEYTPLTHSERIKQKTIRATNLIRVLFRFRNMIFNRKYGRFGCVLLPMNIAMLVIVPLAILIGPILLSILTLLDPTFALFIWSICGIIFLSVLIFSKEIVYTFFEFEYSLLKALYRIIFTKRTYDQIEKVVSTRNRAQLLEVRKR
jgi:cellulose synthase/poly-beta-1,6-N-acetylglucosamine synthase-like glycosyltransferase